MNWYHKERITDSITNALEEVVYYLNDDELSDEDRVCLTQARLRLREAQMWADDLTLKDEDDAEEEDDEEIVDIPGMRQSQEHPFPQPRYRMPPLEYSKNPHRGK